MDLPRSTRALLEVGQALCMDPSTQAATPTRVMLDIGSVGALVASSLGCGYLHDHWGACTAAQELGVAPIYHADQLPPGPYSIIFLEAKELDPALTRQFAAEAADRLGPDGLLVTTAPPADVTPWFEQVTAQEEVLVARLPRLDQPDSQAAALVVPESFVYPVQLGEKQLVVHSAPGIFSPRGLDPGSHQMLQLIRAEPGQHFLDLGCGAGVVSLVASQLWGCQVTAVDVSARALRLTRLNAPTAQVLPSDGFSALAGQQFDLIASNPPYHTDFAVAKSFIEGAYHHLTPGGWLYLVVKRADWYERKLRSLFGGCRRDERGGYTILSTQRRHQERRPAAAEPPRTTKKHAKRMASTRRHRATPRPPVDSTPEP